MKNSLDRDAMENVNIPNLLTISRILLVPVFAGLVLNGEINLALFVFLVACLTDALDGFIAKRFSQTTELGANIDPLADKLLLITAFVLLTVKGLIPTWLCVLVLLRDLVIVTGVLSLRWSGRKVEIAPTILGKITTTFQIITVFLAMLLAGRPQDALFLSACFITALLTAYTGFEYVWREVKIQTAAKS